MSLGRAMGVVGLVVLSLGLAEAGEPRPGGLGGDETVGPVAAVERPGASIGPRGPRSVVINHGSFGGAPYARVDAGAVQDYKDQAAAIAAGGYVSDFDYRTLEACLISFDGHSTYATDRGGCIYIQTVITGLQAGDIVEVDNDYFYDEGSGYYSFWDQAPYWLLIGAYTHNSTATILNWLIYVADAGDGTYTAVIGSGEYNLALHNDDLTTVIGDRFRLTRDVKVWQGATLVSPLTSSRGYTYSNTGITGGTEVASAALDQTDMELVGADPVYVDDDWAGSANGDSVGGHVYGQDAFAQVQRGIAGSLALVTGSTVNLAPGLYEEQVEIALSGLQLVGAGRGADPAVDSIIRAPVGPLPYHFITGTSTKNYPVVAVHDATGVAIQNLRVDGYGRGNANYRFSGIAFFNADGAVDACAVVNIQDTPFSGAQHGVGIYAYNTGGGPYAIAVTGTEVSEYQKNGMALLGSGLTATVSGCTATGKGPTGVTAQNGIQIGSGAGGSVTSCTVSGHVYTGPSWAATGVLLASGTTVDVTGCVLTDNYPGIYYQDTDGTVSGTGVTSTVAAAAFGLIAYNSAADKSAGPRLRAAPLLEEAATGVRAGDMAVTISGGTFSGVGATDSVGVYPYSDGATLTLTMTGATVRDWDYGILAQEAAPGVVALAASDNRIVGNVSYGLYAETAGTQLAENNDWGSGEGPLDAVGTYEVSADDCGSDPAAMVNTALAGQLGNAVGENVDYCPWRSDARLTLRPQGGDTCYRPGETLVVEVYLSDVATASNIVGGDFFLEYDPARLDFSSADPGDDPFVTQVSEAVDEISGLIDYAVGVTPGGPGTQADTVMARITFTVLTGIADDCAADGLVAFRSHDPPVKLSDYYGNPVYPALTDLAALTRDGTPPVLSGCGDVTVPPELGTCEAEVALAVTAADNCSGTVPVTYEQWTGSAWAPIGNPHTFPAGTTPVRASATDTCGNTGTCEFDVVVESFFDIFVEVHIDGLLAGAAQRCITFEVWDCDTATVVSRPTVVAFAPAGTYAAGSAVIQVPCGLDYDCITARDRLHSLRRTAPIEVSGGGYVAAFTDGKMLLSGNLNDDKWIDILDYGVYSWQFVANPAPGADTTCATPYPHADFTGDGVVNAGDFTPIFTNYLKGRDANCCGLGGLRDAGGPITEISVLELRRMGLAHLTVADLNGDGWLDAEDVAAFMSGQRPRPRPGLRPADAEEPAAATPRAPAGEVIGR